MIPGEPRTEPGSKGRICANCGHKDIAHEFGECWIDLATDTDSWNPVDQCPCGWWEEAR